MTSCTASGALVCLLALACAAPALAADYATERAKMASAAPKDAVLFTLQAGLAALGEGKTAEAGGLFDAALVQIEGMFANSESAAKARSLWYEEGAKDYKGEPYERSMAFHYRGLLYLAEGDYENARASFRGGVLQDAFAEEEQYRSDFASLMLLEGWANQLNGDSEMAADAYGEVARLRPGWIAPAKGANWLVVAELGGSPRKLGDGIGNAEIVYRRAKRTPERSITVQLDGVAHKMALVEDIFVQAATRGGRPVDRLIEGKVSFAKTTDTIGNVFGTLASEGAVLRSAGSGSRSNALGALAAVGAIASIISANVKPRADVRYWNNLPDTVHVMALAGAAAPREVKVQLFDENGNPVPLDTVQIRQWRDAKGNGLLWIKSRI
jgi:tetratricopeptide (TPR) repeat protein